VISIVIASPTRFYRDGLAEVLKRQPDMILAAEVRGAEELELAARRLTPAVVLLDMGLPDSLRCVRSMVAAGPAPRVVALGVPDREREVIECAEAGVAGYVTRDDGLDDLLASIRGVVRDELRCSAHTAAVLLRRVTHLAAQRRAPGSAAGLTRRELEVVALMELGLSNKQIAARLQIELATVKNHVHNILEKLDVERRGEAVVRARGAGLLELH
jgi:two-component system nitrate/nitrite response regulator NarL